MDETECLEEEFMFITVVVDEDDCCVTKGPSFSWGYVFADEREDIMLAYG
jgi:hypothetical protein